MEVRFTLEVVTPLFVAGADQRQAELRAPSFRGEMRYWLRALAGGIYGTTGPALSHVWEEEKSVFGTTDQGSAVIVRLELDDLGPPMSFERDKVQYDARGQKQPTGRDYLFWSMAQMGRDGVKRQYYPPGCTFTLTLSQRGRDHKALEKAVAALWLLTYLGGIGARSRRAAGSLAVIGVSSPIPLPLSFETPETAEQFSAFLRKGLDDARSLITSTPMAGAPASQPLFDVLFPSQSVCRIWVLNHLPPWRTSQQALEAIGASMRDFRSRRDPDHREVARWLTGQAMPRTIERTAFGLPIQFRYSNGGPSGFVQSTNHAHDRRASPILLRVAKLGGTPPQYVGVAVLFKAQFLPPGERLEAKNNRSARPLPPPDNYSLIEQWIDTFPSRLGVW